MPSLDRGVLDECLHRLYIGEPAARLRDEDRRKSEEMRGLLAECAAVLDHLGGTGPLLVVDAAAGKAYAGLLLAELVLARQGREARVALIERDAQRVAACRDAVARVRAPGVSFTFEQSDVSEARAWPSQPDLVVALHACGSASDAIIDRAIAARARRLLLVPCCYSKQVTAAELAEQRAEELGLPRHAEVRRRFVHALVDAERTLRLEAAGWQTIVVSFVAPTVTPHHLLWRSSYVGEPGRMAEAASRLSRLRHLTHLRS